MSDGSIDPDTLAEVLAPVVEQAVASALDREITELFHNLDSCLGDHLSLLKKTLRQDLREAIDRAVSELRRDSRVTQQGKREDKPAPGRGLDELASF